VTIGKPLPTYMVVILDEHKDEVVAEGKIGEIGIAGIALAVGYLNREDLTRQKFIPDFLDLPNNPSKRIYRTGDYGRLREDGDLEFLGRIDTQVKVRGYRVELGEIEAVLSQLPSVAQAVVQPYEEEPGAAELVAYYTCKQSVDELSPSEMSEALRKQLPCYMVPVFFEKLPMIPTTSNNKADRRSLPAPKGQRLSLSNGEFLAPRTTTERTLAEALARVMKIERASVGHHFFHDLGAHSLLMARFGAEIRKRLHISSVSMQDIYLNPTIELGAGLGGTFSLGSNAVGRLDLCRNAGPWRNIFARCWASRRAHAAFLCHSACGEMVGDWKVETRSLSRLEPSVFSLLGNQESHSQRALGPI
jgi:hypothetical protein